MAPCPLHHGRSWISARMRVRSALVWQSSTSWPQLPNLGLRTQGNGIAGTGRPGLAYAGILEPFGGHELVVGCDQRVGAVEDANASLLELRNMLEAGLDSV